MALSQPILYTQDAFDATQATVFRFNVMGGSQVVANTLTIKNNATLQQVYSQSQSTYQFVHNLPANTLTNGTYYQAYINTQDASGDTSPQSNIIQFYCYSEPTFEFDDIPTNHIIPNSSFNFQVNYNQTDLCSKTPIKNASLAAIQFPLFNYLTCRISIHYSES